MSGQTRRIAIVLNGISLQKKIFFDRFLPHLKRLHSVDVFETRSRNDGIMLSAKATEKFRYDVILAAGGDGTLHQVVNGVLSGHENEKGLPAIGIIPIGSGNDFAKTAKIGGDPSHLTGLLARFQSKAVDIGNIVYRDFSGLQQRRYFVNVADIGMGPEVVRRVLDSGRILGSEVAYFKSILQAFFTYRPMVVRARADGWEWTGKLRSLAIANGKYYGHGLCVAPEAKIDDGLFMAFICGDVSVLDFIRYSNSMKKSRHINHPEVHYRNCTSVSLESDRNCMVEGDGEILGTLPAVISFSGQKLNFLI
ncbi:MAG TPA: diacylglycerol kinase family protein [Chryseosolibacter sp.]|nr:diacylglycerol kinase family protein [Chryseosolibacter sp.]